MYIQNVKNRIEINMKILYESLFDIDDNIDDDSIIYYNILKKSYSEHRLDSELKKEIMDEAKKIRYFEQISKPNINRYKLLLIRAYTPYFDNPDYEYYYAIAVNHGNGYISYIDFGEERYMNTIDKTDFYKMLFAPNGYFPNSTDCEEVYGIIKDSKLVKNIAKALEMIDSKL